MYDSERQSVLCIDCTRNRIWNNTEELKDLWMLLLKHVKWLDQLKILLLYMIIFDRVSFKEYYAYNKGYRIYIYIIWMLIKILANWMKKLIFENLKAIKVWFHLIQRRVKNIYSLTPLIFELFSWKFPAFSQKWIQKMDHGPNVSTTKNMMSIVGTFETSNFEIETFDN